MAEQPPQTLATFHRSWLRSQVHPGHDQGRSLRDVRTSPQPVAGSLRRTRWPDYPDGSRTGSVALLVASAVFLSQGDTQAAELEELGVKVQGRMVSVGELGDPQLNVVDSSYGPIEELFATSQSYCQYYR
jgi:hypothetical protein